MGERKVSEKKNQEIDNSEFMLKLMQTSSQSQVNRVEYLFCAHRRPWVKVKGPAAAAIKEKEKTEENFMMRRGKKTYNDIVLVCAKGEEWKKRKKRKAKIFLVNILPPRGCQMALAQYVVAVMSLLYVCCTLMMTNIRHDSRKKTFECPKLSPSASATHRRRRADNYVTSGACESRPKLTFLPK